MGYKKLSLVINPGRVGKEFAAAAAAWTCHPIPATIKVRCVSGDLVLTSETLVLLCKKQKIICVHRNEYIAFIVISS